MSDTEICRVSVIRMRRDEDEAIGHRIEVSDGVDVVLLAGMASWFHGYAKGLILGTQSDAVQAQVRRDLEVQISSSDGTPGPGVGEAVA